MHSDRADFFSFWNFKFFMMLETKTKGKQETLERWGPIQVLHISLSSSYLISFKSPFWQMSSFLQSCSSRELQSWNIPLTLNEKTIQFQVYVLMIKWFEYGSVYCEQQNRSDLALAWPIMLHVTGSRLDLPHTINIFLSLDVTNINNLINNEIEY